MNDCSASPSGALLRALGEFNRGDWFECHETLEVLWMASEGESRDFYQGLLQVAVALHHWRRGNFPGAVRLLEGAMTYLSRVPGSCHRIDVAAFLAASDRCRSELLRLGRERMSELDPDLLPRMRLVPSE